MKSIVITGSTRGIGYGLAKALLEQDCQVVVSGRKQEEVDRVVKKLSSAHSLDKIFGVACDVTLYSEVERLWDASINRLGHVDIWINNAGIAHPQMKLWEHQPEQMQQVVETNLVGVLNGVRVAIRGMLSQGFGSLYNMEGLGSDGRRVDGMTLYGTTKYGLHYLTNSLVEETRCTPVLVGSLSPGMVVTDLLTEQYEDRPEDWERAKRIFNILADRVDTVAPWMAKKILENRKSGVRIKWLTRGKLLTRFLTAPLNKRDLFSVQVG